MTPGEMEREIAWCLVWAMADGFDHDGIEALVMEMMADVLPKDIEFPDGERATGVIVICDHRNRFAEVKLRCT